MWPIYTSTNVLLIYRSVPDYYKNQEMCTKAVHNYSYALGFVSECCEIYKMCDKSVSTHPPIIKYVPECHKTQEM